MAKLGPDKLVFNSTNLLTGGIHESVEAAVAGGYSGITVWREDVERAQSRGLTLPDIKSYLDDHGLVAVGCLALLGLVIARGVGDPHDLFLHLGIVDIDDLAGDRNRRSILVLAAVISPTVKAVDWKASEDERQPTIRTAT